MMKVLTAARSSARVARMVDWTALDGALALVAVALQITAAVSSFFASLATAAVVGAAIDGKPATAWASAAKSASLFATVAACQMLAAVLGEQARLRLRAGLVASLHRRYFRTPVPYWMLKRHAEGSPVDTAAPSSDSSAGGGGVDQRLTQDVDTLASAVASLFFGVYLSPGSTLPGAVVGVAVSSAFVGAALSPFVLGMAVTYAVVTSAVTALLVSPRAAAYCTACATQAALRQALADVVDHAEAISWWAGHAAEERHAFGRLRAFRAASLRLCAWEWADASWSGFLAGYPYVLCYALLAAAVLLGGPGALLPPSGSGPDLDASRVAAAAAGIASLISTASLLPRLCAAAVELGGYLRRIVELDAELSELNAQADAVAAGGIPVACERVVLRRDSDGGVRGGEGGDAGVVLDLSAGVAPTTAVSCDAQVTPGSPAPVPPLLLRLGAIVSVARPALYPPQIGGTPSAPRRPRAREFSVSLPHGGIALTNDQPTEGIELASIRPAGDGSSVACGSAAQAATAMLATHTSFMIRGGGADRLWLHGPSGCGKTSLQRCVAGLHPATVGDGADLQWLACDKNVMFLPQGGYAPMGSLEDCVRYPLPQLPGGVSWRNYYSGGGSVDGGGSSGGNQGLHGEHTDSRPLLDGNSPAALLQPSAVDERVDALCRALSCVAGACSVDAAITRGISSLLFDALAAARSRKSCVSKGCTHVRTQRTLSLFLEGASDSASLLAHLTPVNPISERLAVADAMRLSGLDDGDLQRAVLQGRSVLVDTLSHGQQQRVAVSRVLFHRPAVAWLDESTSNLDNESQAACLDAIAAQGTSLVVSSHRPSARASCTKEVLFGGQASSEGLSSEMPFSVFIEEDAEDAGAGDVPCVQVRVTRETTPDETSTSSSMPSEEQSSDEAEHSSLLLPLPENSSGLAGLGSRPRVTLSWSALRYCGRLLWLGFISRPPRSLLEHLPSSLSYFVAHCVGRHTDPEQLSAWVCASLAIAIAVIMSRITVFVAFLPGAIFSGVIAQNWHSTAVAFGAATAWYVLSPTLGAGARALGKSAGLYWYSVLARHALRSYLKTPASLPTVIAGRLVPRLPGRSVLYALHFCGPNVAWAGHQLQHGAAASSGAALPDARYASSANETDRPDQYIGADARSATEALATLLFGSDSRLSLVQVLLTIGTTAAAAGSYSPGAVALCVAYTAASLAVAHCASRGIPAAQSAVCAMEGALRAVHTRVLSNAAAIGLMRGEGYERLLADAAFAGTLAARGRSIAVQFAPRLFNNLVAQCGTALAYALALAVVYGWGSSASGDGSVDATLLFGLSNVLVSLNLYLCALPDYWTNTGEAVGYASRVCAFFDAVARAQAALDVQAAAADAQAPPCTLEQTQGGSESGGNWELHVPALRVVTPSALGVSPGAPSAAVEGGTVPAAGAPAALVDAWVLRLDRPVAILGPSGAGKTSILRVLAGLWPTAGSIRLLPIDPPPFPPAALPPPSPTLRLSVMFVPSSPRILDCASLAVNLVYPSSPPPFTTPTTALAVVLAECELAHLAPDLGTERPDWSSRLSGGEQQRLAVGRVLFARPTFAIFDEGFTAVSAACRCRLLRALRAAGVACAWTGHGPVPEPPLPGA